MDVYDGERNDKGVPVMPPPYSDIMKTPVTIGLDSRKENGKRVVQAFKAVGRLKEDFAKGGETPMGLLVNSEVYQSFLEQQVQLTGEKRDLRKGYQNALVRVKNIRDMVRAELEIKKTGFRTGSMENI